MKNLIITVSLIFSFSLQAAITLVSDLDDTIKITNAGDEVEAARRAILSDDVFTGMPEFIKAAKLYVDEVHVLSASPTVLKAKIQSTFKKKGIVVNSIILKNPLRRQTTHAFKVEEIKRLMERNSGDDFILVGDDVNADPEVFAEISELYPNRVLASYIHVVQNRALPPTSIKWWTSFDLFLREHQANRMIDAEVAQAGARLSSDMNFNMIIPDFADCPKTPGVWLWQMRTRFMKDAAILMAKLNLYCTARQSTILY
ncbi:MAG TPA: phosphatase domain-containing protein [Bacteriovoracaceae bacterium]|nr:phosphatase domain-containing protein [Bacteriovoracaceae bacterium]